MNNTVLIVGLGKIGMLNRNNKNNFNNHADLFYNSSKFKLLGGVDINKKNVLQFKKKYSLKAYLNFKKAYYRLKPNIILISVDTLSVSKIYIEIIKNEIRPDTFILEKPGSFNYYDLKNFKDYCKKKKINLIVNYQRNFSNLNIIIKKNIFKIKNAEKIKKIEIIYKKGLFNSCSHYLNFLLSILSQNCFNNLEIKKRYKNYSTLDYFLDFSFNSNILINFKYKEKQHEKIIFIYNKFKKIIYKTERKQVYSLNKKKQKKIISDINLCQQNLLKQFDVIIKKKNYLLKNSLLTLKLLNRVKNNLLNSDL